MFPEQVSYKLKLNWKHLVIKALLNLPYALR